MVPAAPVAATLVTGSEPSTAMETQAKDALSGVLVKPAPTRPALVRGFTGCPQESQKLKALVTGALASWRDVDHDTISIEEMSGEGEVFTHRASASGAEPGAVAIHCWTSLGADDPIYQARTSIAGRVMAENGLAPPRLAEGGDWWIEPWEGSGNPIIDETRMAELGELVARIHKLNTDWFNEWREKLCQRTPKLYSVPHGSHVWWWTSRKELLDNMPDACLDVWLQETNWFAPTTKAASRLVTVHADLHAQNMLQTQSGIRVIDFEYTCATHAVQDLAFTVTKCCHGLTAKRSFIRSYLEASGFDANPANVDAVLLDAELGFLGCHCGPLELWIAHDDPDIWLGKIESLRPLVEEVRRFEDLQAQVLEKGIITYLTELKMVSAIGRPVVVCDMPLGAASRFVANEDGTISPEARRSDLAIGVSDKGSLQLVRKDDVRNLLVFQAVQAGTQASKQPFKLILVSHLGQGVFAPAWQRRSVKGLATVQPLTLGTVDHSISAGFDGAHLFVDQMPVDAAAVAIDPSKRYSFYIGDVEQDIGRQHAKDLSAAADANDVTALQALIAKGADLNWPQEHESLGHTVCRAGHVEALNVLLANGLDINATAASYGGSALIEAATFGHVSCIRRLLQVVNLNLHLRDDDKTALEWALDPSPQAQRTAAHVEIAALIEARLKAQSCSLMCGYVS